MPIRLFNDGAHGVRLNNEIKVHDKMDNPGPREMACIMETSAGQRAVFAVNADISKAHRRVRVKPSDWGVQAARTSKGSRAIWLNKVGAFGVASAALWWSRLMGLIGRMAISLRLQDWIFMVTFVDLHIAVGGSHRWLTFWRVIACLELIGTPFSYKKFVGGFQLDYVGFWMDYSRFEVGMSEKRTAWLVRFVDEMQAADWLVHVRRFQEFHGRLGFASQILPWMLAVTCDKSLFLCKNQKILWRIFPRRSQPKKSRIRKYSQRLLSYITHSCVTMSCGVFLPCFMLRLFC